MSERELAKAFGRGVLRGLLGEGENSSPPEGRKRAETQAVSAPEPIPAGGSAAENIPKRDLQAERIARALAIAEEESRCRRSGAATAPSASASRRRRPRSKPTRGTSAKTAPPSVPASDSGLFGIPPANYREWSPPADNPTIPPADQVLEQLQAFELPGDAPAVEPETSAIAVGPPVSHEEAMAENEEAFAETLAEAFAADDLDDLEPEPEPESSACSGCGGLILCSSRCPVGRHERTERITAPAPAGEAKASGPPCVEPLTGSKSGPCGRPSIDVLAGDPLCRLHVNKRRRAKKVASGDL